jgi:ABC-2 type transport system ATP-binding protein
VLLFAALCNQRPVVVLDEPLGVFDPLQLIEVNDVLVERARAGASVLLSVHQMSEAQKLAHRILLLDAGRVLAFGSFEALRAQAELPGGALEDVFLALLKRQYARA